MVYLGCPWVVSKSDHVLQSTLFYSLQLISITPFDINDNTFSTHACFGSLLFPTMDCDIKTTSFVDHDQFQIFDHLEQGVKESTSENETLHELSEVQMMVVSSSHLIASHFEPNTILNDDPFSTNTFLVSYTHPYDEIVEHPEQSMEEKIFGSDEIRQIPRIQMEVVRIHNQSPQMSNSMTHSKG